MKKVIMIGKVGAGKTTFIQRIKNMEIDYKKTQSIEVIFNFIDTPGEYLESWVFYRSLNVSAAEADVIALLEDCTARETYFPPAFSSAFAKDIIGIVTKVDLAESEQDILDAEDRLRLAGANNIFRTSSTENIGFEELRKHLFE